MKNVYPSLDNFKYKDKWYVLNIGGDNLRLMTLSNFEIIECLLSILFLMQNMTSYVLNTQRSRNEKF